jgi:DNA polymerase-3 subunit delta
VLLTTDAARLIAEHLGDDAGRVAALVDVLAAASTPGVNLGVDDVRPYLGEAGGVPSYQLTNAIEAGDSATALELLHRLLTVSTAQQSKPMHPLQIMGVLNGYYRRILRLDDPSLRSPADAVAALGGKVKEYPARKALGQARSLGSAGIRQAFDALFQADLDLKGARGIPEQAVMEVLVVRLARLSARTGGGRRR